MEDLEPERPRREGGGRPRRHEGRPRRVGGRARGRRRSGSTSSARRCRGRSRCSASCCSTRQALGVKKAPAAPSAAGADTVPPDPRSACARSPSPSASTAAGRSSSPPTATSGSAAPPRAGRCARAGRDPPRRARATSLAGGTWMGVSARGVFAGITNYHAPLDVVPRPRRGARAASSWRSPSPRPRRAPPARRSARRRAERWNPFHLLVADAASAFLWWYDGERAALARPRARPARRHRALARRALPARRPRARALAGRPVAWRGCASSSRVHAPRRRGRDLHPRRPRLRHPLLGDPPARAATSRALRALRRRRPPVHHAARGPLRPARRASPERA